MELSREQANAAWQSSKPEYCWHEGANCNEIIDAHSIPKAWLAKIATEGKLITPVPISAQLLSLDKLDPNAYGWPVSVKRGSTGRWSCDHHDKLFNDELLNNNPVLYQQADSAAARAIIHSQWAEIKLRGIAQNLAEQGIEWANSYIQTSQARLQVVQQHAASTILQFKNNASTELKHITCHIPSVPMVAGLAFIVMPNEQGFATLSVCPISTGHIVLFSTIPSQLKWLIRQLRKFGVAAYASRYICCNGQSFHFAPQAWEAIEKPYTETHDKFNRLPIEQYDNLPVPDLFEIA